MRPPRLRLLWIFFAALVFAPSGSAAPNQSTPSDPAPNAPSEILTPSQWNTRAWRKLLHMRDRSLPVKLASALWGGAKERSDLAKGSPFFLNANGHTRPDLEFMSTLEILSDPRSITTSRTANGVEQGVRCAYPARVEFLRSHGYSVLPLTAQECPDFFEWKASLAVKSITLVYSAAYPNNPASMFGHTLLRLNRAQREENDETSELLSYSANFEARVEGSDPALIYAAKGLLGGYAGEYAIAPFYNKINEYTYSESRDLWEYELNLTQTQVDRLVDHLWELYSSAKFDYYFLDENCSYQLLALIEAAQPDWELTDRQGALVVPLQTVKEFLRFQGALRKETLRPSLYRRMNSAHEALSPEEKKIKSQILAGQFPAKDRMNDASYAQILDAALLHWDYRQRSRHSQLTPEERSIFKNALLLRAQIPTPEKPKRLIRTANSTPSFSLNPHPQTEAWRIASDPDSPLLSHSPRMLSLGLGWSENALGSLPRLSVGFRPAFHDQVDPMRGFPSGFAVRFMDFEAQLAQSRTDESQHWTFRLERFQFLEVFSLHPAISLDPQISWNLRAGIQSMDDAPQSAFRPLEGDPGLRLEAGPGLSQSFLNSSLWIFGVGLFYADWIPEIPKAGRYGLATELGLKWSSSRLSTQLSSSLASRIEVFLRYRPQLEFNRPYQAVSERWGSQDLRIELGLSPLQSSQIRFIGNWIPESDWRSAVLQWRWYLE